MQTSSKYRSFRQATTVKPRGNKNFGKPRLNEPVVPTQFEKLVKKLHLRPNQWAGSSQLRAWCSVNRNHRYIPEPLLEAWGFEVRVFV